MTRRSSIEAKMVKDEVSFNGLGVGSSFDFFSHSRRRNSEEALCPDRKSYTFSYRIL